MRDSVGELWVNISKNGRKYVRGTVFGKKVVGFQKVTEKGVLYEVFEAETQKKLVDDV